MDVMLKVSMPTPPFGPEPAAGNGTGMLLAAGDSTRSKMSTKPCRETRAWLAHVTQPMLNLQDCTLVYMSCMKSNVIVDCCTYCWLFEQADAWLSHNMPLHSPV